jgi:hypothetical protein
MGSGRYACQAYASDEHGTPHAIQVKLLSLLSRRRKDVGATACGLSFERNTTTPAVIVAFPRDPSQAKGAFMSLSQLHVAIHLALLATSVLALSCDDVRESGVGTDDRTAALENSSFVASSGIYVGIGRTDADSLCTATLISPYAVLTAAHCFEGDSDGRSTFYLGNDQGYIEGDIIEHPLYELSGYKYDHALIRFDQSIFDDVNVDDTGLQSFTLSQNLATTSMGLTWYGTGRDGTNCAIGNFSYDPSDVYLQKWSSPIPYFTSVIDDWEYTRMNSTTNCPTAASHILGNGGAHKMVKQLLATGMAFVFTGVSPAHATSETLVETLHVEHEAREEAFELGLVLHMQSRSERDHTLVASATATVGWEVQSSQEMVHTRAGEELPPLRFTVRPGRIAEVTENSVVAVRVDIRDATSSALGHAHVQHLRVRQGKLEAISLDEYRMATRPEGATSETALRFEGVVVPFPEDVSWPDDVPGIPADEARKMTAELKRLIDGDLTETSSALTTFGNPAVSAETDVGCASGATGFSILGVVLLLLRSLIRRRRAASLGTILVGLIAMLPNPSRAAQHCAWGTLVFWDTRSNGQTGNYVSEHHPGWRLEMCNTGLTACAPADTNCCYTAVNGTELTLLRHSGSVTTALSQASVPSGTSGLFAVCDSGWLSGYTYTLRVNWKSKYAPPAYFQVRPSGSGSPYYSDFYIGSIPLASTPIGQISINAAGDTASTGGDVAHLFRIAWDTFNRLEGDGETRHRKTYGSGNAYDLVHIEHPVSLPSGVAGQIYTQSNIQMAIGFSRGFVVAHEIGHLWQWRSINRIGVAPNPIGVSATALLTSEGITLAEGIADMMAMAYLFDPQVASSADMIPNFQSCFPTNSPRANEASNGWNSIFGLWELIDANTGNTYNGKSDATDVSLKVLMDAQVSLAGTTGGGNRTVDEGTFTPTGTTCAAGCANGDICGLPGSSFCITGDVHAVNLRDWTHHLPNGGGSLATQYEDTLISCQCLGAVDNLSAGGFTGGFRSD